MPVRANASRVQRQLLSDNHDLTTAAGEWQIKDSCWKGEPVCIACASASSSVFAEAGSLNWRLKDASVWPPVFREEPTAAALLEHNFVSDTNTDADSDAHVAAATLSCDNPPPPLPPEEPAQLDNDGSVHFPPLPRAQRAPVLRRAGGPTSNALYFQNPNPQQELKHIIVADGTLF